MDALFAREVQFFVRRSGKLFKDVTETGERQLDSSFAQENFFGSIFRLERGTLKSFQSLRSSADREFESRLVRQLVPCFSIEISLSEMIAKVPRVSLEKVGASGPRERSLEIAGAF
jgi:hypothetical protein